MSSLIHPLSAPVWQHLALSLLHTLWQGLAVAVLLGLLLRRIPADRPEARYGAAFAALLGLLFCGLATWSVLNLDRPQGPSRVEAESSPMATGPGAGVDVPVKAEQSPGTNTHSARAGRLTSPAGGPGWLALVVAGWLAGATVMMVRMVWAVGRLGRFVRGPEVIDPGIRQMLDELCRALGVRRALRVVETAEAFGPAVLGIVRPVITLPLAMMTGLPHDTIRAMLAHELAHVRRHDFLFNLVQMVIETVLFFNPAVWWINRQIRIEREACCDAVAARALGQPLVLAEALSVWAEWACAGRAPVAAFARQGRQGPMLLLDRIRRMLLPDYRPPLAVSASGLLGLLLGGLALLVGLACGTTAVVGLAAEALTPAERIERVIQTQRQYAPPDPAAEGRPGVLTLSGTVRTHDGRPLPDHFLGTLLTRSSTGSSIGTCDFGPQFSLKTSGEKAWLCMEVEGYAPAVVGPFSRKAGDTIADIHVVLEPGFPLAVRVADEQDRPVEGATVWASPIVDGSSWGRSIKYRSDAKGVALVPNAVQRSYRLSVERPGFQPLSGIEVAVKPGHDLKLSLVPTRPLRGVVMSPEGKPLGGVVIRQYSQRRPGADITSGPEGRVLATTAADGRFVIDELSDDSTYALLFTAGQHRRHLVHSVTTKQRQLQVELGPELTVAGTIRGDIRQLAQDRGEPFVTYGQEVSIPFEGTSSTNLETGRVPVKAHGDGGTFAIRGLLPGKVSVTAGQHTVQVSVGPSQPQGQVTIDLARPAARPLNRQVVIRVTTPDGAVSPRGTIQVSISTSGDHRRYKEFAVPLQDGVARFEAEVPCRIDYRPSGVLGYWFPSGNSPVEPGQRPHEITVGARPAGAIAGQVLNLDGTPASENVSIGTYGVFRTETFTQSGAFGQDARVDAQGKFFRSPLPLNYDYVVTAARGHAIQSSTARLDDVQPTARITLQFPRTTSVEGEILDPQARPLPRFQFRLTFSGSHANGLSPGRSWGEHSDASGRFRFDDLSVDTGRYALEIQPRRDFCAVRVPLPLDGKPISVRLAGGLVIEGRLLDSDTGLPVPGVELYAMASDAPPGTRGFSEPEGPTDAEGRFRFSNLEDRPYSIHNRSFGAATSPPGQTWMPGAKGIVLSVSVPDGSPFKRDAKKATLP